MAGGAGFIGSHLIDRLLAQGDEVICADNLFTGSKRNIEHLQNNPHFQFLCHDVCVSLNVDVEEIYNLASPASPIHYQRDPVQTTKTAALGAINCWNWQSSAKPQFSKLRPVRYTATLRCIRNQRKKLARIFNTYGPRVHPCDGRVVSNFIVQALTNGDIRIFRDGRQTRSFCFVDDFTEGIVRFMRTSADITGPLNLGHAPMRDDPSRRRDGWPQTALREGLKLTLAYFEGLMQQSQGKAAVSRTARIS